MNKITKLFVALTIIIGSMVLLAKPLHAQTIKSGNTVTVDSNQSVDSSLFVNGKTVTIAGTVKGDIYCLGTDVIISGNVNGDVMCLSQNISISGKVEGNVRLVSQNVNISGRITGSSSVFSQTLSADKSSSVTKDMMALVSGATLNGMIGRDSGLLAQNVSVNGSVGRNVKGQIDNLTVGSNGHIWGNVDYASKNDIYKENGARIDGTVTKNTPKQMNVSAPLVSRFSLFLYVFVALNIVSLLLALLFPKALESVTAEAQKKPAQTLAYGIGSSFVVPAAILLATLTVIGIPLAGILLLVWFVVISLCGPTFAYLVGKLILRKQSKTHAVWVMFVGGSIVLIGYFIPIINGFVMAAAFLFGTGMIVRSAKINTPKPAYIFNATSVKTKK